MRNTLLLSALVFLLPLSSSAHGAIQKVVEGKYILNLTSAPLAPEEGEEQQNVLSISDVRTNSLIEKNVLFTITITKDGEQVYGAQNVVATGGLLPFTYTYEEPGIYELFADFSLPGETYLYEPEDIWIQVVPEQKSDSNSGLPVGMAIGIAIGIAISQGKKRA